MITRTIFVVVDTRDHEIHAAFGTLDDARAFIRSMARDLAVFDWRMQKLHEAVEDATRDELAALDPQAHARSYATVFVSAVERLCSGVGALVAPDDLVVDEDCFDIVETKLTEVAK